MDACRMSRRQPAKNFRFGGPVCRQFLNGSCRFGQHCHYLHEWPPVQSVQVCRYFQKGGCWFGDNCRFLHIPRSEAGSSGARRGSAPVIPTTALPSHVSDRRGSEPLLLPQQGASNTVQRGSGPLITSLSINPQSSPHLTTNISEEEEYATLEAGPLPFQQASQRQHDASHPSKRCGGLSRATLAVTEDPIIPASSQQTTSLEVRPEDGATVSGEQVHSEAYNQSKDVLCGICMDKVYEKSTARERRFGILPNCSHAFCLGCIMTWRKTKEFQEDVIKACPQCRVKSTFYIPSKYWVSEGVPKTELIASFKEKSSKMKCNLFMRDGCCPFGLECIFSHDMPPGHRPHRRQFMPKSVIDLMESMDGEDQRILIHLIALTLLDDEDFDFLEYELH